MARGVVALSFAVLLAVFEIGSCIRCYQCNSQNDPKCRDPFDRSAGKIVECSHQDSANYNNQYLKPLLPHDDAMNLNVIGANRYCHKIVTKTGTIVRACLDSNPMNKNQTCQLLALSSAIDPTKALAHCSVCDSDNCNGVGAISASLPLAALTVLVSYLIYKQ